MSRWTAEIEGLPKTNYDFQAEEALLEKLNTTSAVFVP